MQRPILILGGYGNFGKRITRALVKDGFPVLVTGRNQSKARALVSELGPLAAEAVFDANKNLPEELRKHQPKVLINTCGPFQSADYNIANTCIGHGVHYIDLADGRDFVAGIRALDDAARSANVSVVSGVSTVPGLSSAVLDYYKCEFTEYDELIFGISPGQQAERGLATTQGILTFVGKPLRPFAGHPKAYGWQEIHRQHYPDLGSRWMANCDIPDLDLLPERYNIRSIKFSAGLELSAIHLGLWGLSWLIRLGLPINLPRFAPQLLALADWFNRFGSAAGGMHMIMRGNDCNNDHIERRWFIIAKNGHGPHIPTIPAIILAKRWASNKLSAAGAYPCIGLVSLENYLEELEAYAITIITNKI